MTARRKKALDRLKQQLESECQIKVHCIVLDLAISNAAQTLFENVKSLNISVDYLVNNAGFGGHGNFHERDWKDQATMLQLNVVTLTQLCHLFLPQMAQRNSGRILNVASSAGLIPGGPLQSVYFATKAYVVSFSQGLAGELVDTSVTVTALCPGATKTEFEEVAKLQETDLFKGASFTAEEVAEDAYKGMMKGDLKVLTALTLFQKLSVKMAPLLPTRLALKMVRDMQEAKP